MYMSNSTPDYSTAKVSASHSNPSSNMIFLRSYGTPFNIFIQVEDIYDRHKLVKSVRNAGALITSEPEDADIILVDSSTIAGRRFIRTWRSDPGIVVLEYSWAWKCLNVGRALLMHDNWGGLEAVDDGKPTESHEVEGEPNPLPTPRPSPTESIPPPHTQAQSSTSLPLSQEPVKWSSSPAGPSSTSMPPPLPPSLPDTSPPPPVLPLIQASTAFGTQADMPITPAQYSLFMTLMDVMRHKMNFQAQIPSQEQSDAALLSQTLPISNSYQHQLTNNTGMMETINPSALSTFPDPRNGNQFNPHYNTMETINPSTMSPFPDHRRGDMGLSPSASSASLTGHEYCDRSTSLRPSSSSEKQGKERRSFSVSMSSPEFSSRPPTPSASQPTTGANNNLGQTFLSRSGRPFRFFVQVDLQGRHGIVMAIKRNQGKIVNNITDADYVILFTRSKTFPGLAKEAQNVNKRPLQSSFVVDCVKEGVVLDDAEYVLDCGAGSPNRKQSLAKSARKSRVSAKGKEAIQKPSKKSSSLKQRLSSSPPLPAASHMTEPEDSVHSQSDLEFFRQYARSLVESDPSITKMAVVQKMHDEMPHHSFWQNDVGHQLKMELDQIRQDVARSRGQKMNDEPARMSQKQRQNDDQYDWSTPSKKRKVDSSPYENDKQAGSSVFSKHMDDAAVAEDLAVISHFFANGGGDDQDDERVWDNLRQHRPCRSAESWPEFYLGHENIVQVEIERLVAGDGLAYPEESRELLALPNPSDDTFSYIE